jgi:hypothetical protein
MMTAILSALAALAGALKTAFSWATGYGARKETREQRKIGGRDQELDSLKGTQRVTVQAVEARRTAASRSDDDGLPYDADAETGESGDAAKSG